MFELYNPEIRNGQTNQKNIINSWSYFELLPTLLILSVYISWIIDNRGV